MMITLCWAAMATAGRMAYEPPPAQRLGRERRRVNHRAPQFGRTGDFLIPSSVVYCKIERNNGIILWTSFPSEPQQILAQILANSYTKIGVFDPILTQNANSYTNSCQLLHPMRTFPVGCFFVPTFAPSTLIKSLNH